MQLSTTIIYSIVLALAGNAITEAAPIAEDASTTEETGPVYTDEIEGTSHGVEFPFSDAAIIEAIPLPKDVAPIVLKDSVFFVNTTIVEQEFNEHAEQYQKRDAEAWHWNKFFVGQPFYKREVEGGLSKREADAQAEAWHWNKFFVGQPFYKREASAEADAQAWHWNKFFVGQPFYKREVEGGLSKREAEAWHWNKFFVGQPFY